MVMTFLEFILGVVPLALASGAGVASHRAIGTGIIRGMLGAVCHVFRLGAVHSESAAWSPYHFH